MSYVITMIAHFAYYLIGIIQLALLVRAILSWFDPEGEGLICRFAYILTEPILILCQKILDILSVSNNGPIDISFFLAVILMWFSQNMLEALI